jgi:hypothetical protein
MLVRAAVDSARAAALAGRCLDPRTPSCESQRHYRMKFIKGGIKVGALIWLAGAVTEIVSTAIWKLKNK